MTTQDRPETEKLLTPAEVAALFRPTVHYEGGLVTSFELPRNDVYADPKANIAFFIGGGTTRAMSGIPSCVAKQVTRPIRLRPSITNREARPAPPT